MQDNLYMEKYRQDIIDTASELIKIRSVKSEATEDAPFGEGPKKALDKFLDIAKDLGFKTGNVDNYAGYIEFGSEDEDAPLIAVVCHLDVVPEGEWEDAYEPKLDEENDLLIGRGSVDDKGPTVAVLYAMKDLLDSEFDAKCRIRLIVGTDEENGSGGLDYYVEHAEVPVAAFTADADFPVINAEKGQLNLELVWDNKAARPEDGEFKLFRADCGTKSNVVPGEAKLVFKDANGELKEKTTEGKMGHASAPQYYKNAIQYALADAYELSKEKGSKDKFLEDYMQVLNTEYDGESLGVKLSDEPSGDLSLNVGLFSLEDDVARITIDIRYPVTYTTEEVLDMIKEAIKDTDFSIENVSDTVPLYVEKDDPLVALLMNAYNEVTGDDSDPVATGGGSYARHVPNTVAFGANFPGVEYLGHAKYEYTNISDLIRASEIFRLAIQKLDAEYGK